jgi:hypothetical protein
LRQGFDYNIRAVVTPAEVEHPIRNRIDLAAEVMVEISEVCHPGVLYLVIDLAAQHHEATRGKLCGTQVKEEFDRFAETLLTVPGSSTDEHRVDLRPQLLNKGMDFVRRTELCPVVDNGRKFGLLWPAKPTRYLSHSVNGLKDYRVGGVVCFNDIPVLPADLVSAGPDAIDSMHERFISGEVLTPLHEAERDVAT